MLGNEEVIEKIQKGCVGILPTDTLYGIVCSALDEGAVERLYKIKNRNPEKAPIILISDLDDLEKFGIEYKALNSSLKEFISQKWPGPNTIAFLDDNLLDEKFLYLHRNKSLAFRIPRDEKLRGFLKKTGPIIAPSANAEGDETAPDIKTAKEYFGNKVDFYVDDGIKKGSPSSIFYVDLSSGEISQTR
jgi:L-threonylcarbamoyladenylate synthase